MTLWWDKWSSRPDTPAEAGETGRSGLPRLFTVTCTVLAIAALTYVVPGLGDYRPWVSGEPVPLMRLVTFEQPRALPVDETLTGERAREALASSLGETLAENLGEQVEAIEEPALSVEVASEELKGLVREIEDPSGTALDPFYEALSKTAEKKEGAITRVAHWGDSTIGADDITYTVRRRMQNRFGEGGHGFLLVARGYMPYRHKDVLHKGRGFKVYPVIHGRRRDGRYGYGGVSFGSWGGGRGLYGTMDEGSFGRSVSRFEVFYQAHGAGGDLKLVVDDGDEQVLSTRSEGVEDRWHAIDVEDGPHRLKLRTAGHGEIRLYGVVMEAPGPGVVYDSLGIVGARAARLLNMDREHFIAQIRHRSPDLLILAFGGNEAGERHMGRSWYREKLTEVVRLVRAGRPEAACMLMAPLDQGEKGPRGRVRTIPVIHRIVDVQREVAAAEGCGFFNTFEAMGGNGSMGRWHRARPRLGWGDFRHATPAGYEVIGNMFYKALLKGFSDYLDRKRAPSPDDPIPVDDQNPSSSASSRTSPRRS